MPSVKYKNGSGWFSITNSGLKASESTYGVAKVATKEELEAGTSDDTFVTPKKVRDIFYEKNHGILHYDWIGTLEEYTEQQQGGTIDPNWICFITDDEISNSLEWGNIIGQVTNQTDLIAYINANCYNIPSLSGNANKYLTNNGSTTSWANPKAEIVYWD